MGQRKGLLLFAVVAAFMVLTWIAFSASLPPQYLAPASVAATVLFMFLPVCGIFLAAGLGWSPKSAVAVLVLGVAAVLLLSSAHVGSPWNGGGTSVRPHCVAGRARHPRGDARPR
ncbi:MAG: hypothetical protein C4341_03160 [Armatimonadota bacterium]